MRSWKLLWSSLIVLTLALAPKHRLGNRRRRERGPSTASRGDNLRIRSKDERAHAPSAPIVIVFGDARCRFAGALLGRADR
jgi:hypothetical protein